MLRLRSLKIPKLAIFIVAIPLIISCIYYSSFALDRYVSIAQVAVRQSGAGDAPQMPGLAVMLGGLNPTSREETLYLREFITSADMLAELESQLSWSKHYAERWSDPLYLLGGSTSRENILDYYRRVVTAHFDEITGLLTVEVQAFDQEFAQETLKVILAVSERFVNELSHKMAREQMRFAQGELAAARKSFEFHRQEMLKFQSDNKLLDAQVAAEGRATIIADLESQLTKERASLKAMQASLNSDSPQVRQQKIKIKALEDQVESESRKLVSPPQGDRLNVIAANYRNLTMDAGIAEEAYKYAVSAVETARIEASKKIRSLVTVVSPNKPEEAIYPRRIYNLLTIFMGLLLFYGIVRFIVSTIEDHQD